MILVDTSIWIDHLHSAHAVHHEVLQLVQRRRLFGHGLSLVSAHLLAVQLSSGPVLWTRDKRLRETAERLGVAASHR